MVKNKKSNIGSKMIPLLLLHRATSLR